MIQREERVGPDLDGWSYHVLAVGQGREWTVTASRRRVVDGKSTIHRIFFSACDGVFEAGRKFECFLQTCRDYVIERRAKPWPGPG